TLTGMTVTGGGSLNVLNSTLAENSTSVSGILDIQANSRLARRGLGILKTAAMNIDDTGLLDVTDGKIIVDYTGSSPITVIQSQIAAAYHDGMWDGTHGITSANAAVNSLQRTSLGYG